MKKVISLIALVLITAIGIVGKASAKVNKIQLERTDGGGVDNCNSDISTK